GSPGNREAAVDVMGWRLEGHTAALGRVAGAREAAHASAASGRRRALTGVNHTALHAAALVRLAAGHPPRAAARRSLHARTRLVHLLIREPSRGEGSRGLTDAAHVGAGRRPTAAVALRLRGGSDRGNKALLIRLGALRPQYEHHHGRRSEQQPSRLASQHHGPPRY